MKKLIATLGLSLLSTSLFAARLPTMQEFIQQDDDFQKAPSIAKYIEYLKQDKYDMFTIAGIKDVERTPNVSAFAADTVQVRLNPANPLGTIQENFTFLKMLIDRGLDVNAIASQYNGFRKTLLNAASQNCSSDTIQFLLDNGAVNESDSAHWTNSLFANSNFRLNPTMTAECLKSTKILLKGQTDFNIDRGEVQNMFQSNAFEMSAKWNVGPNLYLRGILLDSEIATAIKTVFNFNPSKKPTSARPDDHMISEIDYYINWPSSDTYTNAMTLDLWNKLSTDQKEWSCYRSSLDEALEYLQSRGYDINELKTKNLPVANPNWPTLQGFGSTWIDIIFPYCESLKK